MAVTTTDVFDQTVVFWLAGQSHAVPGPYNAAVVGLITGNPQLTKRSTLADVTEPTFPGYAATAPDKPATWLRDQLGNIAASWDPVIFQPTDATDPTTVTGWFLAPADLGGLYAWEFFAQPVALPDQYTRLGVIPRIALGAPPSGVGQTFR